MNSQAVEFLVGSCLFPPQLARSRRVCELLLQESTLTTVSAKYAQYSRLAEGQRQTWSAFPKFLFWQYVGGKSHWLIYSQQDSSRLDPQVVVNAKVLASILSLSTETCVANQLYSQEKGLQQSPNAPQPQACGWPTAYCALGISAVCFPLLLWFVVNSWKGKHSPIEKKNTCHWFSMN